ncbi:TolC family protein [Leptospira kanakyensis]|uniref:TolC family protein n=1 Tax=Leptospira kanakyensis TaxID=2484968 RepID=UPI00223CBC34|nr:TolC family protein [Leptospira kanakyensis]MCW7480739.1 TolC family protein [Leptospira kanakyensis]
MFLSKNAIVLAFLLALPIYPQVSNSLSLKEVLDLADSKADLILAGQAKVEEAEKLKQKAGKYKNPNVSLDYGRRRASNEAGPEYSVGLSQDFYYPGKRDLRIKIAEATEKNLLAELEQSRLEYRFSVIKLVYSYLIALEKASHIQDRIKRVSQIESFIEKKVFVSPETKVELYLVQNRILSLQKHLIVLEQNKQVNWENLNFFLGLDKEVNVVSPWLQRGKPLQKKELIAQMIEKNPILKQSHTKIQQSKEEVELAKLDKYSDIKLQGSIGEDKSGVANRFFDLGVSFAIPSLDTNEDVVKSIQSRVASENYLLNHQIRILTTRLNASLIEYESINRSLDKFSISLVPSIEQKLSYADIEFRKGRISLINYLELEMQLHETHEAIYDYQMQFVENITEILFLTNNPNFQEAINVN